MEYVTWDGRVTIRNTMVDYMKSHMTIRNYKKYHVDMEIIHGLQGIVKIIHGLQGIIRNITWTWKSYMDYKE
jgi:hypothetical protein